MKGTEALFCAIVTRAVDLETDLHTEADVNEDVIRAGVKEDTKAIAVEKFVGAGRVRDVKEGGMSVKGVL